MVSSVGLFGIFTGFIASFFVAEDKKNDHSKQMEVLIEEVRLLRTQVEALAPAAESSRKAEGSEEISSS